MTSYSPDRELNDIVREKHLSVKVAASLFGYSEQYLRRLLRSGRLDGVKIGQVWLIRLASLEAHLRNGSATQDQRFGPQGLSGQGETGRVA